MGVAVELRVCTRRDNFVEAAELERAIRSLMGGSEEGRKAKEKARKMKAACRKLRRRADRRTLPCRQWCRICYKATYSLNTRNS